jgi:cell pole-organizing protein PopZ
MTQPAKGQEPSMEEILASIRRIIADDDPAKGQRESPPKASEPAIVQPAPPPRPAPPPPRMAPPPPPPPEPEPEQDEIDAMLAQLEASSRQAPPAIEEEPVADILDLTEQMAAADEAPAFRTIDGQSDVVFDESPPEPPAPRAFVAPSRPVSDAGDRGLISAATGAAVDSAFNSLAQTVLVQNGRTLEDLVREMLRPMLKTWLDDNLPGMVERLVRAEIERVSRGRG